MSTSHVVDGQQARRATGGAEFEYVEYVLPRDDVTLTLPWRTIAAAQTSRPARVLLSAAWALYLGLRVPSEMQLSDRAMHLRAAREAMCTPPSGVKGTSETRWQAVAQRFQVYERIGITEESDAHQNAVEARVAFVRNLASHSGDIFSLAVGTPIDSTSRKEIHRGLLVPAITRADIALAATAIPRVASGLLHSADAANYDPTAYERNFV